MSGENISPPWREQELSLQAVKEKYSDLSPFIILKIDVQRRGAKITRRALDAINPEKDAAFYRGINLESKGVIPYGFLLRDGTSVLCTIEDEAETSFKRFREPYTIDLVNGRPALTDQGEFIDEIYYLPNPHFTNKVTTRGTPMWHVLMSRPQRMDINLYQTCDFWKLAGMNCKYCVAGTTFNSTKGEKAEIVNLDDVEEAVVEALKQPGRYRSVFFCSGSMLGGAEPQDDEVNLYIEMLQRVGKYFRDKKVMSQIVATAFTEKQLRRLHNETMLCGYTADLEVLNEEVFNWVCPGKAKYIGYQGWKERLFKAAEIFGPGSVSTGVVSGVEMVEPQGFKSEEEALEKCLAEAEDLAKHGVTVSQQIYHLEQGSVFQHKKTATLDYLTAFAKGIDQISRRYNLECLCDDYRTCGNHPSGDLARIWQGGKECR
ncbi:radical SAM protein [Leadbettera azotonutricia]|uniref:Radical SAM core domain-containing protein n=1 Tax=Leadbettera azotonutricia (strain ATCC BAA-888 / DSM 13862 / ZAS-9) TaxID=545695 RepID=F5Y9F1_LEAAZ|nr:radical SAM protein [Leadbettera azotonutricia]AEF80670.1 hypothetical protein TREAZ_2110 [Leadbettera azotonutricia ZAS-9]